MTGFSYLSNYPSILELPDGIYNGIQTGDIITIKDKNYKSPIEYKGANVLITFKIENNKIEYLS